MKPTAFIICFGILTIVVAGDSGPKPRSDKRPPTIYMNQFAVHVPDGPDAAKTIAEKHGFDNHGQVRRVANIFTRFKMRDFRSN